MITSLVPRPFSGVFIYACDAAIATLFPKFRSASLRATFLEVTAEDYCIYVAAMETALDAARPRSIRQITPRIPKTAKPKPLAFIPLASPPEPTSQLESKFSGSEKMSPKGSAAIIAILVNRNFLTNVSSPIAEGLNNLPTEALPLPTTPLKTCVDSRLFAN